MCLMLDVIRARLSAYTTKGIVFWDVLNDSLGYLFLAILRVVQGM